MARYNSGFVYDPSTSTGTYYGAQDPSITAFNSNIAVFQADYKKNQITWDAVNIDLTISGGSHQATHWKIVKSPSGVPDHPDYAKDVIGGPADSNGSIPSSASAYNGFYLDTETKYPAGTEVAYSFWVYNGIDWLFCGSADSIVVEDLNNTTLKLMKLLPSVWITGSYSIGGMDSYPESVDAVTGENTDLYRYLYNFGFYYDKLHQQVENVYNSSNYRKFPSRYLGSALSNLGFQYEPTLGIKYAKSLYRFGNMINSLKGSNLGVNLYIRALTHLTNQVSSGTNLMLSSGASSFEGSVVTWGGDTKSFTITKTQVITTKGSPSSALITLSEAHGFNINDRVTISLVNASDEVYDGIGVIESIPSTTSFTYGISSNAVNEVTGTNLGTVTHSIIFSKKYSGSGSDLTTADRPTLKLSDTSNILRDWYGQVTMSAATATMTSYYTTETFRKITQSVPVTPGNEYYFSGYIRRSTGNTAGTTSTAGIQAAIQWFDFQGNFVGSTNYGTKVITTAAGTWYSFESSLYNDQIVAPPTAAYAGIKLYISGATAADKFYLDSFQFTLFPDNHNISYGMGLPIFQEARTATLQIDAVRTNLIRNPSFEVDVSSWGYLNGRLTLDTSTDYIGNSSCLFTANSTNGAVHSDWMVLESDTWYTFSAYVKGPDTKTAKVGLEFTFPTSAANQNTILTDAYSKYLDPTTNVAYSSTVTINSTTWTRITYTVKSPQYVADNGLPIAKAIISFPATTSSESYWVDACLLEKSKTAETFFSGAGGDTLTNPLNQKAVALVDCLWEKRVRTNWVDHSVFGSDTTGSAAPRWSNATGGTNTVSTDQYKFGTKSLKVVITTTGAYANTYTILKYPSKKTLNTGYTGTDLFYGGEPVTASAYIYSSTAGYYNIILSDNSGVNTYGTLGSLSNLYRSGASLTLTSVNQNYGQYVPANTWTRISQTFTLPRNTSTSTVGCRLGIGGPVGTMYVDGVQLELGRTPTPFIDPTAASSIGNTNPKDTSYTIYSSEDYLNNSGRSYYWPRRESKFVRLGLAISNYLPLDVKNKFIYGAPQPAEWPEVDSSLVPNSSFENGTEGWTTDASTTTVITHTGLGSLFVDSLASKNKMCGAFSPSWLIVDSTLSAPSSMGVTSPWTPIPDPNYQHYLSVAIKTGVTNAATSTYYNRSKGTYVVTATWYAADKTTTLGTSTLDTLTLTGGNTNGSGNTYGVYGNRWNIADGYVTPPLNTSYAKISIVFTPTTPSATNEFFVDRVILKQV